MLIGLGRSLAHLAGPGSFPQAQSPPAEITNPKTTRARHIQVPIFVSESNTLPYIFSTCPENRNFQIDDELANLLEKPKRDQGGTTTIDPSTIPDFMTWPHLPAAADSSA